MSAKKKVYGFVELSSMADFVDVSVRFAEAPTLRLISAEHRNYEREHHIAEEIGEYEYPEETIKNMMAARNLTRELVLRRCNYGHREGYLVLVTETMIYILKQPNEALEELAYPRAKKVSWKY